MPPKYAITRAGEDLGCDDSICACANFTWPWPAEKDHVGTGTVKAILYVDGASYLYELFYLKIDKDVH